MESEFRLEYNQTDSGVHGILTAPSTVSQEFLDSLANKTLARTQAHPVWAVCMDENGASITRQTINLVGLSQEEEFNSLETRLIEIAQVTSS
jgi:hypothetical protein